MSGASNSLRLGIVGCGHISHSHGGAAAELKDRVRFVSCCDVVEDSARRWKEKFGCETSYTNYEEMIARERLDGVLLATWPSQHREQIENCLKAGARRILCEKSLALTGEEALAIWRRVREADAFVMEGFMYRHHPVMARLVELLKRGEAGAIDSVRAVFNVLKPELLSAGDPKLNWRQRKELGGGVPFDFACYAVNACRFLASGRPAWVRATGGLSERYGTIHRMYALIQYSNGIVGILESSNRASFNQEVQVNGSEGILYLPMAWTLPETARILRRHPGTWGQVMEDAYTVGKANPYRKQLENFAAVIHGEERPLVPLSESVANTYTLEALVRSFEQQRDVQVDIPGEVLAELDA